LNATSLGLEIALSAPLEASSLGLVLISSSSLLDALSLGFEIALASPLYASSVCLIRN
jgi:hypothetical protein